MARDLLLSQADISSLSLGRLTTMPSLNLETRLEALTAMEGGLQVVGQVAAGALGEALELRQLALKNKNAGQLKSSQEQMATADQHLVKAIDTAVSAFRVDERQLTARLTAKALTKCGFHIRTARGVRSNAVWAERGHQIVAALVQDGGALELDTAGVSGGGCNAVMEELRMTLDELGVDADIRRRVSHGDDRGGQLIQRACLVDSQNPELGLIKQFEEGLPSKQSAPTVMVSRRRLSLEVPNEHS